MARKTAEALIRAGVQKMGSAERQAIEQELRDLGEQLQGGQQGDESTRPDLLQDKASLLARKRKLEEMLNRDDDLKASSGNERDRLVARIKDLEQQIKNGMPTEREAATRSMAVLDYERAVVKTVWHQKNRGNLIREWQQLKRRLEPDNPLSDDVSQLQA